MSASPAQKLSKQEIYDQYVENSRIKIAKYTIIGMIGGFITGGLYDLRQWSTGGEISFAAIQLPTYVLIGGGVALLAPPAGYFSSQNPRYWDKKTVTPQT